MKLSLSSLLHSCQNLKSLKSIHARLLIEGTISFSDVALNRILRIYSRYGSIDYARKLFNEIPQPNAFLWTALIHGHVENRLYEDALFFFRLMLVEAVPLINFTFSSILKACSRQSRLRDGESIHGFFIKYGLDSDLVVQNSVLDFYLKCGEVSIARRAFDDMQVKDVVSWNSMISGYGNSQKIGIARELFDRMPQKNVVSWTAMICGYVAVGDMPAARSLFERVRNRDLAAWNVMISGYMDVGDFMAAVHIFDEMPKWDIGSWNLMISGFCKARKLDSARDFFDRMPKRNVFSWTIMVDGHIKVGDVENARCLFDQMPERNLVSWSTMISGYAKNGQPNQALKLFEQFEEAGIDPDETFIVAIVSTCAQLGILDTAEKILHKYVRSANLLNQRLVTSLIDMYAKCGAIEKAFQVFGNAHKKDLVCYSAMITAFANHGRSRDAIYLFDQMLQEDIKPDGVTFISVLSACNHGGLVDEGKNFFKLMIEIFFLQPSERHYACMVDLLGRAGFLEEAYELIKKMPIEPHSCVWGALLAA